MTKKKLVFIAAAIVLSIVVFGGIIRFGTSRAPARMDGLQNCLQLRTGTVGVEVAFSDDFISADSDKVRLYKEGDREKYDGGAFPTIMIYSDGGYMSVDGLIRMSLAERPGPLYDKKVTFNNYEAAFAQTNDQWGAMDYYEIPVGNRTINLSVYATSTRSESETRVVEEMLRGIKIKDGLDDVKDVRVEECE